MAVRFDPFAPGYSQNPYPQYHALRAADPVHRSDLFDGWVLTRHRDVFGALRAPGFSVDRSATDPVQNVPLPRIREEFRDVSEGLRRVLMFVDPPDHTRIRRLVRQVFGHREMWAHRARIQALADTFCEGLLERGPDVDWIRDLAYPLPVMVIAEVLGVPSSEGEAIKGWSDDLGALLDPYVPPEKFEHALKSAQEMYDFLMEVFDARTRKPRDDLISHLLHHEDPGTGQRLTRQEIFSVAALILGAGHLTTTNLLGNAVWALGEHPEERRRLTREPRLIARAVEEFLRYDAPLQATARLATAPHRIDDKTIEPGDFVVVLMGAANRDPARFPDPDRLDFRRRGIVHASFGQGIHLCLGRTLARLEIEVVIGTLLRRFPGFEIACDVADRKPNVVSRGLRSLPLQLGEPA
ncbi:MAG: cytochrome P450 [Myxococcota bacterium]